LTGYNEAFIISGEKRKELINQDPKSDEIIRPLLRGRDIKRYGYEFADLYLLFIPWHFPLHNDTSMTGASKKAEQAFQQQYPAIYNHLVQYKRELSGRNKAETGIRYEWYALQRWGANYWEDFYRPKIVWTPVNSEYRFTLLESGIFFNNSLFMIVGESLHYICALFNSKLFVFYLNLILSNEYTYGSRDTFSSIPLLKIEAKKQHSIVELVKAILYEKDGNMSMFCTKIDEIVYELYGLSNEEIEFIESQ
jgi:hypothetical protein